VNDPGGVKNWSKVENLFHSALALPLSERVAFLKQACQGDAKLYQEAQTLLDCAASDDSFLETSPLSSVQKAPILLPGATLGNFEIHELLGEGGMGEVYKARDTRLARIVAIKRSREQFSAHFRQEARAVAALNHPNICTLYDIGPDYLVMEFIEGETLQSRLERGPLPPDLALPLAIQLADALQAAHGKGIVHRDLKPANIMLAGSGLKVLDFGLAKIERLDVEAGLSETHTSTGLVMGTVPYMAPEQLQGKEVDLRSDIFSFGLVLYEMLTGRKAFAAASRADSIAAILTSEPDLAVVPAPLVPLIRKCIAKEPSARWQSAETVREELARLSTVPSFRRAYVYVAMAVGVLVAAAAFLFLRPQPKPLTDKDMVVLADFSNTTGDPVFTGTLRQALAIQLEQSPFLKILEDDNMRQDLRSMGKNATSNITNPVAREICQREGDKAMISGSIANLGKSFVIDLLASACQSGQTLAHEQLEAQDKEHVLRTVASAAASLRRKLGESLASVPKASPLADNVTTTSLEALQAFTLASQVSPTEGPTASLPLLQRAVQLDPSFAAAYESMAVQYAHSNNVEKEAEYYSKAFALAGGLPERERLRISCGYYLRSLGDLNKGIEVTRLATRLYPRDSVPHNLLGAALNFTGDLEGALEEFQQASRLNPRAMSYRGNMLRMQMMLGRFDLARSIANDALAQHLDPPRFHQRLLAISLIQADQAAMQKEILWFQQRTENESMLRVLGANAAGRGRLREAQDDWHRAAAMTRRSDPAGRASSYALDATIGKALADDCDQTHAQIVFTPLMAISLALCGRVLPEKAWVEELSKRGQIGTLLNDVYLPAIEAAEALHAAQPEKVLEAFHPAPAYERVYPYIPYLRGLAFLRLRKGAEAAVEFRKVVEHPGASWILFFDVSCPQLYQSSRLGLARALVMSGEVESAKSGYKELLEYWKDADHDFRPAIDARREYQALLKKI